MGIILDLIILAILAVSVYNSARYGFVRTVAELAGYIVAVVLVTTIDFPVGTAVYYRAIIFFLLIIATKFAARLVNKLFSFSILGKINRILGGILGVPKGILLSLAFCLLAVLIVTVCKDGFLIFTDEAIESSYIFKQISSLSLFK